MKRLYFGEEWPMKWNRTFKCWEGADGTVGEACQPKLDPSKEEIEELIRDCEQCWDHLTSREKAQTWVSLKYVEVEDEKVDDLEEGDSLYELLPDELDPRIVWEKGPGEEEEDQEEEEDDE